MVVEHAHAFAQIGLRILDVDEVAACEGSHLLQVVPVAIGANAEGEDHRVVGPTFDRLLYQVCVGWNAIGEEQDDAKRFFIARLVQLFLGIGEILVGLRVSWKVAGKGGKGFLKPLGHMKMMLNLFDTA